MANLRKSRQRAETEPKSEVEIEAELESELILRAVRTALVASGAASKKLALAFSGGLDSTVLLHAVANCVGAERCIALHIHHGLSAQADAWLAHCEATAQALGVAFVARRVEVQQIAQRGLEAAAREVRYAALDELCQIQAAPLLLLAHHADDQAETVLLQLLRGAGPAGLAAMPFQRDRGATGVERLRPLLAVPRIVLAAYAKQHRLRWVEDASNQDPRYRRNALRHLILPRLEEYFPAYRTALARAARHAAQSQQLLDELAALDLPTLLHPASTQVTGLAHWQAALVDAADACVGVPALSQPMRKVESLGCGDAETPTHSPDLSAYILVWPALRQLSNAHPSRASNLIRYWMRQLNIPTASSAWLDALLRQLQQHRIGQTLRIAHAGYCLCAYREQVWWELAASEAVAARLDERQHELASRAGELSVSAPVLNADVLHWSGETSWHLAQWKGTLHFVPAETNNSAGKLSDDSVSVCAALLRLAPLSARPRQGGERMRQTQAGRNRSLKNLFQETGIPVWQRDVPLIYVGEALLFVPHLGLNRAIEQVVIDDIEISTTPHFCLIWQDDV